MTSTSAIYELSRIKLCHVCLMVHLLSASCCLVWQHLATHLAPMISYHQHCCCFQKAMLIYVMQLMKFYPPH